jgi:SAM-dependent methyltransferase
MRIATRRAAGLDPRGWTGELRSEVAGFFDGLAGEWHTRVTPQRFAVVTDALLRGLDPLPVPRGLAVEVGSGIGSYSALIAQRFQTALAIDLSAEMLKRAPAAPSHRVLADGARLPLRDASASAVILINAFLFPSEVDRVVSREGAVVWVNISGECTPIYLSPDDLLARMPGAWTGVASGAGVGTWSVLRRA